MKSIENIHENVTALIICSCSAPAFKHSIKNRIETSTQKNTSANEKENKQGEKGKVSGLPKPSIKTQPKTQI